MVLSNFFIASIGFMFLRLFQKKGIKFINAFI